MTFDRRLNAPQTPSEGPSLDCNPDSDLQTRASNPDSDRLTLEITSPCTITVQTRPAREKKSRLGPCTLTYEDFARYEKIDPRSIYYRASRGLLDRVVTGTGRNGKPIYGIPVTSLGAAGAARMAEELARQVRPSPVRGNSSETADALARAEAQTHSPAPCPPRGEGGSGVGMAPGTALAPYIREHVSWTGSAPVDAQGHVIVAALREMGREDAANEFARRLGAVAAMRSVRDATHFGTKVEASQRLADKLGIELGTIERWEHTLRRGGEAALVPPRRADEGRSSVPPEIRRQLLMEWNSELAPNLAQIARLADDLCQDRGLPYCSPYAVRRWLEKQRRPKAIELAHRKGKKAFSDSFLIRMARDPGKLRVNELWCADHRLADLMVRMSDDPSSRVFRPMLTAIVDVASADWIGWSIREQPSSEGVGAAIRRGVLGFSETDLKGRPCEFPGRGLPEKFLIDNGREFWGGAMKASLDFEPSEADFIPDERHRTVMTQLGVREIQAIPFNPQSKPIEALFGPMADAENLLPGYCGRNAREKPEALRRQIDRGQLLTLAQYRCWFAGWAAERGAGKPIGERQLSPRAYWQGHQPAPIDPAHLDDMMARDRWITPGNSLLKVAGMGLYAPIEDDRRAYVECQGYRCRLLYLHDDPAQVVIARKTSLGDLLRVRFRRLPDDDDDWGMASGRGASEQYREVQALRTVARDAIRDSARELAQGIDPAELDRDGAWRAAAENGHLLTHRDRLPAPDAAPARPQEPRALPEPAPEPSTVYSAYGAPIIARMRLEAAE